MPIRSLRREMSPWVHQRRADVVKNINDLSYSNGSPLNDKLEAFVRSGLTRWPFVDSWKKFEAVIRFGGVCGYVLLGGMGRLIGCGDIFLIVSIRSYLGIETQLIGRERLNTKWITQQLMALFWKRATQKSPSPSLKNKSRNKHSEQGLSRGQTNRSSRFFLDWGHRLKM